VKKTSQVVVFMYIKGGQILDKIKDIVKIKSTRRRTIKPTAKRVIIRRKK
jgi:hypothetical protein